RETAVALEDLRAATREDLHTADRVDPLGPAALAGLGAGLGSALDDDPPPLHVIGAVTGHIHAEGQMATLPFTPFGPGDLAGEDAVRLASLLLLGVFGTHAALEEGHEVVGGPALPVGGDEVTLRLPQPVHEGGELKLVLGAEAVLHVGGDPLDPPLL